MSQGLWPDGTLIVNVTERDDDDWDGEHVVSLMRVGSDSKVELTRFVDFEPARDLAIRITALLYPRGHVVARGETAEVAKLEEVAGTA